MSRIARIVSRLLELRPGLEVALDVEDPDVAAGLQSLCQSAGATLISAKNATICPAGVVDLDAVPSPLVPDRVKTLVRRVVPGGTLVVVVRSGHENPQQAAQNLGPSFDLVKVHGEAEDGAVVLRGTRRAIVKRDDMKRLRGLAHKMEPTLMIGKDGLSEGLVAMAKEQLARHGLVKAKVVPHTARRIDTDLLADDLAWAAGGQLLQRVGHTCLLFRPDAPLEPALNARR